MADADLRVEIMKTSPFPSLRKQEKTEPTAEVAIAYMKSIERPV